MLKRETNCALCIIVTLPPALTATIHTVKQSRVSADIVSEYSFIHTFWYGWDREREKKRVVQSEKGETEETYTMKELTMTRSQRMWSETGSMYSSQFVVYKIVSTTCSASDLVWEKSVQEGKQTNNNNVDNSENVAFDSKRAKDQSNYSKLSELSVIHSKKLKFSPELLTFFSWHVCTCTGCTLSHHQSM